VLADSGVIDWDRSYVKGQRSMRYQIRERYQRTRTFGCKDQKLCKRVRKLQRESQKLLPVHQWLSDRQTLLEFDRQNAESIISGMFPDDDSPLDADAYKALLLEQAGRLDRQLHDRTPELTVCRFGRVHTAVTRLPTSLRRCLSFEGQPLVGIDLSNSQPLFAGLCALDYYSCPVKKHRLNRFEAPGNHPYGRVLSPIPHPIQPPITMAEKLQTTVNTGSYESCLCNRVDLKNYLNTCEQGKFYESLMQPGDDRGRIKRRTLIDFFFGKDLYESSIGQRVQELYPSISEMVTDLKKHDHRRPSWVMQNREATMFIGRIARRIMVEEPDIPLMTIHDSFLTTEEHADYVQDVAMEEFARLGVTPTFTRETYD
jgi:hypothetical protein